MSPAALSAVEPEYIKPAAAAEVLGVSHDTVLRAVARGDLEAFRYGRNVRISRAALDEFVRRQTTSGPRPRLRRRGAA